MNRWILFALIALVFCCVPLTGVAQDSTKATQQKQGSESCKDRKLDLTGSYKGVLFTDKNQKEGAPATITITGNDFTLASATLEGSGLVSGVNSCGDVSIALRFTQASDVELTHRTVSLDARIVRGGGEWQGDKMVASGKPIIWATAQDSTGKLAGADLAFVVCPEYPRCKKYATCTCPEPPPKKP